MKSLVSLAVIGYLQLVAGCLPVPTELLSKADTSRPVQQTAASATPAPAPAGVRVESAPAVEAAGGASNTRAPKPGRLWVVVKNFQVKSFGIDTDISAEWEI